MSESQTPARYNNSFHRSEHVEQRYVCKVPPGFPIEKVLEPGYWAHVAHLLKPWDEISIRWDDFSSKARLVVTDVGALYAKVALESMTKLEVKVEDATLLEVEWSGPHTKFRVKRGKDVLKDGFADKKLAQRWIDDDYKAA
jgi:hypothetical protein